MTKKIRTDREIVDQTNDMARVFYEMLGYMVPSGHRFYELDRVNYHPQESLCWAMACLAHKELTGTDPYDAVANLDD